MADLHEVLITAELPADLTEEELAELRWHFGQGSCPEKFPIVVDHWPLTTVDEDGEPLPEGQWEIDRYPLLTQRGPADPRIGGITFAELAFREGESRPGWALSSRQVVHSDEFGLLEQLLRWLSHQADRVQGAPPRFSCHTRFYEDEQVLMPLELTGRDEEGDGDMN
ncbi:hypothetical protein HUT18_10035 [Streptomyces sp. NA04227]|uniref:hypothetical protein n=1 Tax=Streptomyces sp. NA04227 TaxID=2742136 RepID=UPI0015905C34|nr:hypothetical protein [Streptomyces sp. NA04227]QKW06686.1 hypothetical protein HUT18_10035 [Streptomyces sp. NA04227]